ncbi:phosphopantothenoylcysteine decarboxylase [Paenibacillaceae bacterium]|nr:phosphopantothenoylcysteine decarboxylase [Paenibacillaceae bacterium]
MRREDFYNNGNLLVGCTGTVESIDFYRQIWHLKSTVCKNIKIIVTDDAKNFINVTLLKTITHCEVYDSMFSEGLSVPHVNLPLWADVFLILCASANSIAKIANGHSDNLLTAAVLNASCPVILVPSMNKQMWRKPSVQRNIDTLVKDAIIVCAFEVRVFEAATLTSEEGISVDFPKLILRLSRVIRTL